MIHIFPLRVFSVLACLTAFPVAAQTADMMSVEMASKAGRLSQNEEYCFNRANMAKNVMESRQLIVTYDPDGLTKVKFIEGLNDDLSPYSEGEKKIIRVLADLAWAQPYEKNDPYRAAVRVGRFQEGAYNTCMKELPNTD